VLGAGWFASTGAAASAATSSESGAGGSVHVWTGSGFGASSTRASPANEPDSAWVGAGRGGGGEPIASRWRFSGAPRPRRGAGPADCTGCARLTARGRTDVRAGEGMGERSRTREGAGSAGVGAEEAGAGVGVGIGSWPSVGAGASPGGVAGTNGVRGSAGDGSSSSATGGPSGGAAAAASGAGAGHSGVVGPGCAVSSGASVIGKRISGRSVASALVIAGGDGLRLAGHRRTVRPVGAEAGAKIGPGPGEDHSRTVRATVVARPDTIPDGAAADTEWPSGRRNAYGGRRAARPASKESVPSVSLNGPSARCTPGAAAQSPGGGVSGPAGASPASGAGRAPGAEAAGRCVPRDERPNGHMRLPALRLSLVDPADLADEPAAKRVLHVEEILERPVEVVGHVRNLGVELVGCVRHDSPRRPPATSTENPWLHAGQVTAALVWPSWLIRR